MGGDNFELFVMVKPVYGYDVRGSETKKRIETVSKDLEILGIAWRKQGQQKYGGQQ